MNSSVVIGNPGSNRLDFWQAALHRQGLPESRVAPWLDLIDGRVNLVDVVGKGDVVRIESPGRDYEVERRLLRLGASAVDSPIVPGDVDDRGLIRGPGQWYLGFCRILQTIRGQLEACPPHTLMNTPEDIAVMFDKRLCHARLTAAGVSTPSALGTVRSYNELILRMREERMPRVFVKLAFGSSGSGVVAFEMADDRQQATTTVEIDGKRLYNSRTIRRYTDPSMIRLIVDRLCSEGVHVEQWIPKAGIDGGTFDLRVVTIAGEPRHAVARISRSPITNLHLLNRRAIAEVARAHVGEAAWERVIAAARAVAACFPDCVQLGVDVALTPRHDRAFVFEVNAFGDLLPGTVEGNVDTYEAQIEAMRLRSVAYA